MLAPPRQPRSTSAAPKGRHPRAGTVEPGDHVFFQHPQHGPTAGKVLAHGRDGFTAECKAGQRHSVPWDRMLGHKTRVKLAMKVIDAGQDGAIVEDHRGQRRFMGGDLTAPPADEEQEAMPTDPLTNNLDYLGKALGSGRPILMLKANIKNAPGLTLKDVTDRRGKQTKRWVRTMKEQPAPKQPGAGADDKAARPPIAHGDEVTFRHGEVRGRGTVVASGRDGVTVRDGSGQTHQVRHDALEGRAKDAEPARPDYAPRGMGEATSAYVKRHVHSWPDPDNLPEKHDRYFRDHPDAETIPLDKVEVQKAEGDKGTTNAPKIMAAAYHGVVEKRDPVKVEETEDGKYRVVDGNGTVAGVQKHGWAAIPAQVVNKKVRAAEREAASLTTPEEQSLPKSAPQPVKTERDLFDAAVPALDQLKTWLDKGSGVSSKMGHKLMTKSPEDVTPEEWASDEGMLFIAPLKGAERSRQKVMAEYAGDWSELRDVVRCSIAVPTLADVRQVMDKLRESGMTLANAPKNRFAKPVPVGYRDMLLNVRMPNGLIAEVQVHAKPMLAAKNEGHHWYGVQRDIEARCMIEKRDPTPDEAAKIAEAEAKQKEIYAAGWRAAAGEKDDTMAKALGGGGSMRSAPKLAAPGGKGFQYFEHDGAYYRRPAGAKLSSITEVLHGSTWKPHRGADSLRPALYGDPVDDPLSKADKPGEEAGDVLAKGGFWRRLFVRHP